MQNHSSGYEQSFPCLGRTLLFWEELYCSLTAADGLEQFKFDGEVFFWVLAEVENQAATLRQTLLRISGAIQVLEEELSKSEGGELVGENIPG